MLRKSTRPGRSQESPGFFMRPVCDGLYGMNRPPRIADNQVGTGRHRKPGASPYAARESIGLRSQKWTERARRYDGWRCGYTNSSVQRPSSGDQQRSVACRSGERRSRPQRRKCANRALASSGWNYRGAVQSRARPLDARESLEVVASIIDHHAGMSSVLVPWAGYPEHANLSIPLGLAEVWAGPSLALNPGQH